MGQKIKWNDTDTNELTNISLILNKTMEQTIKQFSYCRVKIQEYKQDQTCYKAGFVKENWFYLQLVPENRNAQLWITFKHTDLILLAKVK